MCCLTLSLSLILLSLAHSANSQQSYAPSVCRNSTSALGYACNGLKKRCRTYLLFRAQPPYSNASAIASLLGSDSSLIGRLNNVSQTASLVTRKEVIVPVSCSCSGVYYQSNTTYVVRSNDNPYQIAIATFQGLTTCKAIQHQRSGLVVDMFPDEKLTIPLRCACPTRNQSRAGIKYLMSYVIKSGDTISTISLRFGANDVGETLQANMKSVQDSLIQPFTTLLVPLRSPPNSSMTVTPQGGPPPPPPTPPASTPAQQGSTQKWNFFVYGLIAGAGFVLGSGVLGISLLRRKGGRGQVISSSAIGKKSDAEADVQPLELLESISKVAQSLKVFSFKELQSATDDFSSGSRIGGCVYRGEMPREGQEQPQQVAIKQTEADVSREIDILNKTNHANIVTLIGVCYNSGLWYLVYEWAAKGRLSDWIFGAGAGGAALSWEQRIQIALDVATGLDYLHGYTTPPHIHKDLKCSHVLVDAEFRAKISHFGLSKSVGAGEAGEFALTHHIVGTKGYMAPEYLEHGLVTPKMDAYAFGILLVEILTGREAGLLCGGAPLSEALAPLAADKLREFMDPCLQDKYPFDVATTLLKLAERCLRKEPSERPRMDHVVRMLSRALTSSALWDTSTATTISSHITSNSTH